MEDRCRREVGQGLFKQNGCSRSHRTEFGRLWRPRLWPLHMRWKAGKYLTIENLSLSEIKGKEVHGLWYSGLWEEALMDATFWFLWNTTLLSLSMCSTAFEVNKFYSRNDIFVFRSLLGSFALIYRAVSTPNGQLGPCSPWLAQPFSYIPGSLPWVMSLVELRPSTWIINQGNVPQRLDSLVEVNLQLRLPLLKWL